MVVTVVDSPLTRLWSPTLGTCAVRRRRGSLPCVVDINANSACVCASVLPELGRRAVKLETNGDGKDAKQSSVAIRYNSLVERVLGSVAAGGAAPKPSRMLAFTTDSPFPNEFDKAIEAAGFVMPKFSSQLGYTSAHWLTTSLATELLHAATPDAPADAPAAAGEAQPRRVVLACLGAPVFVSALARAAVKPHATLVLACLNSSWKTISELLPEAAREAIVHVSVDDMTGELVGDRPSEREVEGEGQSRPPPDAGRSDGDSPDDIARLIHGALSQWVQQAGGDVSSIAQSDAAAVLDRLPQWKAYRAVRGSLSLKALIKASPELFATEVDDSMPPDGRHIRITPLSGGGEAAEGAASDSSAHAGASAESTGDALSAATSEDDVLRALVREAHARSVAGVHDEKVKVANLKALLSATPSLVKGRDWKAGDKVSAAARRARSRRSDTRLPQRSGTRCALRCWSTPRSSSPPSPARPRRQPPLAGNKGGGANTMAFWGFKGAQRRCTGRAAESPSLQSAAAGVHQYKVACVTDARLREAQAQLRTGQASTSPGRPSSWGPSRPSCRGPSPSPWRPGAAATTCWPTCCPSW